MEILHRARDQLEQACIKRFDSNRKALEPLESRKSNRIQTKSNSAEVVSNVHTSACVGELIGFLFASRGRLIRPVLQIRAGAQGSLVFENKQQVFKTQYAYLLTPELREGDSAWTITSSENCEMRRAFPAMLLSEKSLQLRLILHFYLRSISCI